MLDGRVKALEFLDVDMSYGSSQVLSGLNLEVNAGETLVLIGPSGSGKTTVLRLGMQLEAPTAGQIRVFGTDVTQNGAANRAAQAARREGRLRCGMVFQQYNLFPHMTVLENLVLAPRTVLGMAREESEERAAQLLKLVGLSDKIESYPPQLSGGQQQRIAIARALMMEPQVLFLDEITSALDPELVNDVLGLVRKLAEETDITFMIVTHEMQFARKVADRIAMFDSGRILETGTPEQIFTSPEHERTQKFLKSVTTFE